MDCYEVFEDITQIDAYPNDGINFSFPPEIASRIVKPSDFTIDPTKVKHIYFDENNLPSVSEKNNDTRGGDYRQVSISWNDDQPSIENIDMLESLRLQNHHFIITRADGRQYLLRTEQHCYEMNYNFDGTWLSAGVSASSEVGLMFIFS